MGEIGYYPFGMQQPGRTFSAVSGYRYGFNGKERDKDMHSLTAYDYGFRIYNPAIGRFLSVDPLTKNYPSITPYQFANNTPISAIDIDGLESDKNYNSNESLKDGIGWLLKIKANEVIILFKVFVLLNPYTSLAIKATKGVTDQLVKQSATVLHKNAQDLDKAYSDLQNFYHNSGFYASEYNTFAAKQRLGWLHNETVDRLGVGQLDEAEDADYYTHEDKTHSTLRTNRTYADLTYQPNLLTNVEQKVLNSLTGTLNSKKETYDKQKTKFEHYAYINNFAAEFTPQAIATDILSYLNDVIKGPTKEDGMIIDELKKFLSPKSTLEEKINSGQSLVSYYMRNANTEIAYHIRILQISNLTKDLLIK